MLSKSVVIRHKKFVLFSKQENSTLEKIVPFQKWLDQNDSPKNE